MYKQAILCLMFAMAEADKALRDEELVSIVTMREIFKDYTEHDIVMLFQEYRQKFADKNFTEIAYITVRQIPAELYMGVLSVLADVIVLDFNIDAKEGAFISIVANTMGISDVAVKTLLLTSLSKKLLMNIGKES